MLICKLLGWFIFIIDKRIKIFIFCIIPEVYEMKYILIVIIIIVNGYILYTKLIDYISDRISKNLINYLKNVKLAKR